MDEALKNRLSSRDIWARGLYMVFFAIAYSVAEIVLVAVVIFQFLAILITGQANGNALRLGRNLSTYIYEVLQFQTFNSEARPFPFADWPDEDSPQTPWNKETSEPGLSTGSAADPESDAPSGPTAPGAL